MPRQPRSAYIVHTDHLTKPSHFATHGHWYTSMVASLSPATNSSRVFFVYDTAIHGFAAELTHGEARRLSNTPGVAGVHKDRLVHLHTTRSPGFLGLDRDFGIWPDTNFGDGIIIGFVDSGIWPESASFDDTGLGSVRPSWKGRCVDGERFNASMCNNKLVGARSFTAGMSLATDDFLSPRDKAGHGTHVASTAAGSEVPDAGLFGFARGTARGVAPRARVAMYKACVLHDCSTAAIVAAIDAAVKDGVDILSLSVGGLDDPDFYKDAMSIAFFGAVRAGLFVACSAGNFVPREFTLSNVAPWITTVGAATVDRVFPVSITLGNGQVLTGQSLYAHTTNRTEMIRLLPSNCSNDLGSDRIRGKIVMCARDFGVYPSYGVAVKKAGGSGLVSVSPLDRRMDGLMVQPFTLPAVTISAREADRLSEYIDSVPDPVASFCFTGRTVTGENRPPVVASFSSRGPNHIVREILKPDVIAPGANILAAWPVESPLTQSRSDARRSSFNIVLGTSMAYPHVAGVAEQLKHKHRDWTPAVTAATLDSHGWGISDNSRTSSGVATPMAAGAGHVRPQLALDPGLVYDAVEQDYVDFLCALKYTAAQVRMFVPGFAGCTRTLPGGAAGLNYPSFVVDFSNGTGVRVLKRTVTKVSEGPETYTVRVVAPDQVAVAVTPRTLQFEKQNEKKSYKVVFRNKKTAVRSTQFGHIVWENDGHQVRNPVEFRWT
ncbi:hypothetical protein GQ55_2G411700 [Panicum hallii var. hallii]|uniref:Subtilisin-like protease fibronectin type-III domain-containing protein n=1 Tax=Panicum hallii var. hallii TaxID=1504633 RepID=A0A2T7EXV2_9POAL|nr:hypothetical protein GQ55_2G411700 [Panicum hallii var. hallii]